jgi:dihydroceramide fatty acyl 2-hydroxylase
MEAQKLFVSIKDESVRMFDNKLLDKVSRVHWTTPLYVWVPVVLYCWYVSLTTPDFGMLSFLMYFVIGVLVWTFAEYILHRFVFHYHPTTEWGKRINFVTHGVHHDYPNDSMRLVMPPSLSIPLSLPFIAMFYFSLGGFTAEAFTAFSGMVVGYLTYDMMHYALHHSKWDNQYFNSLKHNHMYHHFKEPDAGFGVSSILWDIVFRTGFEKNKSAE